MTEFSFDCDAYGHRVGLQGPVKPTRAGLEELAHAQIYTIPFENFDILLDRPLSLDTAALFDKLVLRRRGGYCFELNGLFLAALRAAGFNARPLLARVHVRGATSARTHQLSLVRIDDADWIADVGFGANGLRAPIPLTLDTEFAQDGLIFRLVERPVYGTMLQVAEADGWQDLYGFDLAPVMPVDIEMSNHFTATHPDSFFTFLRVATLPHADGGRTSLVDFTLKHTTPSGGQETETLPPGRDYLQALETHFGIVLDAPYEALRPVREDPQG